jgi:hypothetical protein
MGEDHTVLMWMGEHHAELMWMGEHTELMWMR